MHSTLDPLSLREMGSLSRPHLLSVLPIFLFYFDTCLELWLTCNSEQVRCAWRVGAHTYSISYCVDEDA